MTHDSRAAAYADRVLVIGDGRIRDEIGLGRRDRPRRRAAHQPPRRARACSRPRGWMTGWRCAASRARPLRTLLTIVGIALGVGVLYASLATDAGIDAAIDRTVRDLVGRADLRVAAFGEAGLCRATIDGRRRHAGVAVAAPALERRTYLGADRPAAGLRRR